MNGTFACRSWGTLKSFELQGLSRSRTLPARPGLWLWALPAALSHPRLRLHGLSHSAAPLPPRAALPEPPAHSPFGLTNSLCCCAVCPGAVCPPPDPLGALLNCSFGPFASHLPPKHLHPPHPTRSARSFGTLLNFCFGPSTPSPRHRLPPGSETPAPSDPLGICSSTPPSAPSTPSTPSPRHRLPPGSETSASTSFDPLGALAPQLLDFSVRLFVLPLPLRHCRTWTLRPLHLHDLAQPPAYLASKHLHPPPTRWARSLVNFPRHRLPPGSETSTSFDPLGALAGQLLLRLLRAPLLSICIHRCPAQAAPNAAASRPAQRHPSLPVLLPAPPCRPLRPSPRQALRLSKAAPPCRLELVPGCVGSQGSCFVVCNSCRKCGLLLCQLCGDWGPLVGV